MQEKAEGSRREETMLNVIRRQPSTKWKHSDYKGKKVNKHCLAASGDTRMNEDWTSMRLQTQQDRPRTYIVTPRRVLATIVVVGKH